MNRKLFYALASCVLAATASTGGCIQPNADPTIPENQTNGTFFHPSTVGVKNGAPAESDPATNAQGP